MMTLAELNATHALPDVLSFTQGPGDFVVAEIRNPFAQARVCTYAGQVLSYRPLTAADDLLFVSEHAYFAPGKAIKGGIPICWPWFGPDPEGVGRPTHGFLRNRQWDVLDTTAIDEQTTQIRLVARADAETLAAWPHDFEVILEVTVGATLVINLITRHNAATTLSLSQGLHTYFRVGDIAKTQVFGLAGMRYLDKVDGGIEKPQDGAVSVASEVDRIYLDVSYPLTIEDRALNRRIEIEATGSRSAVVWNPWSDKAAAMGDLGNAEYRQMLCVETTNAGPDHMTIAPGETYRLSTIYRLQSL